MSRAERAERRSLRVTPTVAMKRRRMTISSSSAMKGSGEESGSDSSFEEEPGPYNQAKKFKNNVSQSFSKSHSEETKPKVDGGGGGYDENIILHN